MAPMESPRSALGVGRAPPKAPTVVLRASASPAATPERHSNHLSPSWTLPKSSRVSRDTRVTLRRAATSEADMDSAELNHLQEQISQLARSRFPDPAVRQVTLLQYGDEPAIEPGEILVRLVIEPPGSQRPDGTEADALIVQEFDHDHKEAILG